MMDKCRQWGRGDSVEPELGGIGNFDSAAEGIED